MVQDGVEVRRREGRVDRDMMGDRISVSFIFVFSASASMSGVQQVLSNACRWERAGQEYRLMTALE